jgi:PPP family 3-phenylpropionic acid transporter
MSDSMAVTVSKESGIGYGSVRTFGSLGWIIALLSSGWLIARFGYIAGFVGVFGMWIAAAGVILPMRPHYFTSQQILNQPKNNLRTAIQVVLNDRVLFGFAIALIVIGFLNNGVLQFENVFLSDLGASKQLISVAGIMGAIVELPFMIYADRFARRMGVHRLMLISLSMYFFLRMIVLLLPSIVTIMAVRFIGGVAFSFYTVCFIGLISSRTKTSETGTILALYTVTIAGLVNIVAAPISGAIFDVIGPRWLYALSAAGYVIGVFCLWWVRPDPHEAANEKN